jgi:hypothetical protein
MRTTACVPPRYPVTIGTCDLSERRMYVRILLRAGASARPRAGGGVQVIVTGASGPDNPVVLAGCVLANSETGCGRCPSPCGSSPTFKVSVLSAADQNAGVVSPGDLRAGLAATSWDCPSAGSRNVRPIDGAASRSLARCFTDPPVRSPTARTAVRRGTKDRSSGESTGPPAFGRVRRW